MSEDTSEQVEIRTLAQKAEGCRMRQEYDEARVLFEELLGRKKSKWICAHLGATYRDIAAIYRSQENENFEKAIRLFDMALTGRDLPQEEQPTLELDKDTSKYARAWAHRGETLRHMANLAKQDKVLGWEEWEIPNVYNEAVACFKRATEIAKQNAKQNEEVYAWALAHWGATIANSRGIFVLVRKEVQKAILAAIPAATLAAVPGVSQAGFLAAIHAASQVVIPAAIPEVSLAAIPEVSPEEIQAAIQVAIQAAIPEASQAAIPAIIQAASQTQFQERVRKIIQKGKIDLYQEALEKLHEALELRQYKYAWCHMHIAGIHILRGRGQDAYFYLYTAFMEDKNILDELTDPFASQYKRLSKPEKSVRAMLNYNRYWQNTKQTPYRDLYRRYFYAVALQTRAEMVYEPEAQTTLRRTFGLEQPRQVTSQDSGEDGTNNPDTKSNRLISEGHKIGLKSAIAAARTAKTRFGEEPNNGVSVPRGPSTKEDEDELERVQTHMNYVEAGLLALEAFFQEAEMNEAWELLKSTIERLPEGEFKEEMKQRARSDMAWHDLRNDPTNGDAFEKLVGSYLANL